VATQVLREGCDLGYTGGRRDHRPVEAVLRKEVVNIICVSKRESATGVPIFSCDPSLLRLRMHFARTTSPRFDFPSRTNSTWDKYFFLLPYLQHA